MEKTYSVLMLIENSSVPRHNHVWAKAIALRDAGFLVSIIGPKGIAQDRESYIYIDGIHIYRFGLPETTDRWTSYITEYILSMIMTFFLCFIVLFRHGFDVIHVANPPDTFFAIGLLFRLFGKKFVYDQHDLSPEMFQIKFHGRKKLVRSLLCFLEWCSYRTADIVIVPNASVKQFAIERGRYPANRIFVVYNTPDLDRIRRVAFEPALKGGRRYLLAFVGAMEAQDGVEYALYALHELIHKRGRKDVSAVFMGHGDYAPTLHELSHTLQLDEYVTFTGWTKGEDIVRYLTAMDIGLSPDPKNGISEYCTMTKVLEYMAMEKPFVSFDLAETHLSAQEAGLYAIPNLVEDFTDKIEILLDDEELRRKLGAIGRDIVEKELNWNHIKANLLQAYQVLFSSRHDEAEQSRSRGILSS